MSYRAQCKDEDPYKGTEMWSQIQTQREDGCVNQNTVNEVMPENCWQSPEAKRQRRVYP